jgi:hypothetical protein
MWKEYRIPFPVIQKAKSQIERQAAEKFENKELHAVALPIMIMATPVFRVALAVL